MTEFKTFTFFGQGLNVTSDPEYASAIAAALAIDARWARITDNQMVNLHEVFAVTSQTVKVPEQAPEDEES